MSANLLHHPSNSLLGGGGDERFSRRGCKPQTNYTPTLNTAGRMTRKNILFGGVRWPGKHYTKCMVRHPPASPFAAVGGVTWAALPQFLLLCRVLNTRTEHFLMTPALTGWKNKTANISSYFSVRSLAPPQLRGGSSNIWPQNCWVLCFFPPLMSMGPINISGKPTDQKWLLDSYPSGRKKKKSRGIFFSSSLKKKRSQTSSLKREGHKKALKVKRIDEGAEERQKEKERGEENIAGGQLSGLFLEDCFSILQQGWREQGGSVWQLAPGGWRDRRMGVEKGRSGSEWVKGMPEPSCTERTAGLHRPWSRELGRTEWWWGEGKAAREGGMKVKWSEVTHWQDNKCCWYTATRLAWSWQSYENKSIYCFYTQESQNTLCLKALQSVQSDDSLIFEAKSDKDVNQSHRGQTERSYSVGSRQNKMNQYHKRK